MRRNRDFDFSRAIEAPFLLMRRPLVLFGWGLVMMLPFLVLIPFVAPFLSLAPEQAAQEVLAEPGQGQFIAFQMANNAVSALQLVLGLVVSAWATKATLDRRASGFGLGMDEVRYVVVMLGLVIVLIALLIALILVGLGVGAAAWSYGATARAWAIGIYVLLAVVLMIWLLLRTCLMAPMSMVTHEFAVAAGWRATSGRVWKLLGLFIVIWILALVVTLFAYALIFGAGAAIFFGMGGRIDFGATQLQDMTESLTPLLTAAGIVGLPLIALMGLMQAFGVAPLASAAADLAPARADPPPSDLSDRPALDSL
ncbi:MAG: hypothetical protein ACK4Z5_10300 [Brevundimonas sp.]